MGREEDLYEEFHDNPMYWAQKYVEFESLLRESHSWIAAIKGSAGALKFANKIRKALEVRDE